MPSYTFKKSAAVPPTRNHFPYHIPKAEEKPTFVKKEAEEEEDVSDISDTEIRLVEILNTFGGHNDDELHMEEFEKTDHALNWSTKQRMRRLVKTNIRLISSEMTAYLYCHEFKVRGAGGDTYVVTIGPRIHCTCKDHIVRKTHCKHILFVILEELKVTDLTNPIYQSLYPTDKLLKDTFMHYHPTM